jgi:hypothetical protein
MYAPRKEGVRRRHARAGILPNGLPVFPANQTGIGPVDLHQADAAAVRIVRVKIIDDPLTFRSRKRRRSRRLDPRLKPFLDG